MPQIRVEFYKPVLPEGNHTFVEILEMVQQLAINRRIEQAGANRRGILELDADANQHIGIASLIRMVELPNRTNTNTGRRAALDLDAREGLGEEVHFVYDGPLDVIAIQSTQHLRPTAVRNMLMDFTNAQILFNPILQRDAWERFDRARIIKKFHLKIARPQRVIAEESPALRRVLEELEEFDGVSAEVVISVGRENRSLNREVVRGVLRAALGRGEQLQSLNITARVRDGDQEETDEIDFLAGRLIYYGEVDLAGRRLDPQQCRAEVRGAIREHRDYLRQYQL